MPALNLAQASTIVDVALQKGREPKCAPLTVAVLDAGGHLVAFKREDNSGILRFDIAFGKAWGALGMGFGSRTMFERANSNDAQRLFYATLAAASGGRIVTNPGGVLIRDAGGEVIGAVGISGDTADKDEVCAIAGIEAAGLKADPGGKEDIGEKSYVVEVLFVLALDRELPRAHRAQSQGRQARGDRRHRPAEGQAARGRLPRGQSADADPGADRGGGPVLFQSMAIMEYLEETHPQPPLLPRDPRGRARVRGLARSSSATRIRCRCRACASI